MIMKDQLDVLITCSGLGSRLGEITNYTNKSLVRIGARPALSWIIDSYPIDVRFVLTVGHYADHVRQYVSMAYPNRIIDVVDVDKFEGKGSSLAYSMLCAKSRLKKEFVFHACDTITDVHTNTEENCVWVSKENDSTGNYRTVLLDGARLKHIQEKGDTASSEAYIGKCYIKDYKQFWNSLEDVYAAKGLEDSSLSDCHAINSMLHNGLGFEVKKSNEWTDIGNLASLAQARKKNRENINVLDKPEESIFFIEDKVIKFFYDEKIVDSRVKRTKYLSGTTPPIVAFSKNFYAYTKADGEILSRHKNFNDKIMMNLLDWADQRLWKSRSTLDHSNTCKEFYVEKTKGRIKKYLSDRRIEDKTTSINGTFVPDAMSLIDQAQSVLLNDCRASLFHGDFILENILMDSHGHFTLLDWRQDFSGELQFGDAYYDISKLNHNLTVNHDIINEGLYNYKNDVHGNVSVDIMCSKKLLDAKEVLLKFCDNSGYNRKKVELLTAIIWINMSPLHDKKFGDFLFNFGKYNLLRAIKA